jgi:hypothetical protein
MAKEVKKLRLNDLKNCQKTLARVTRDYHDDKNADIPRVRTLAYMINMLIDSYTQCHKMDIEKRLEALEARLKAK